MALREDLEKQGDSLFRWRSYIPFLMLPLFLVSLQSRDPFSEYFNDRVNLVWEIFCIFISVLGLVVRSIVIGYTPQGTSGRNTKEQVAETLNQTGMYTYLRNPLYFGNFLGFLGTVLFLEVWWLVIIAILIFWLYYERIIFREEEFLRGKFGQAYLDWAKTTPAFIPRLRKWKAPGLPFSMKNVIKREYYGLFSIVVFFTLLKVMKNYAEIYRFHLEFGYIIFFAAGTAIFIIIRILHKGTKLFATADR